VVIINRGFSVHGCLEIPVLSQEFSESILSKRNPGGIIRFLIGQIYYLKKARVGKVFSDSGKFHAAQVVGRFEEEIDSQPRDFRFDGDLNIAESTGLFQGVRGFLNVFSHIGSSSFLPYKREKGGEIPMGIRNKRDRTYILSFIRGLRTGLCELPERYGTKKQNCENYPAHKGASNRLSTNAVCFLPVMEACSFERTGRNMRDVMRSISIELSSTTLLVVFSSTRYPVCLRHAGSVHALDDLLFPGEPESTLALMDCMQHDLEEYLK
jgi:hypothetical protein